MFEVRWGRHLPRCAAGRHHHKEPRIVLPLCGTFETKHRRFVASLEPGAALYRPAGDEHIDCYQVPMDCLTLLFRGDNAVSDGTEPFVMLDPFLLRATRHLRTEVEMADTASTLVSEGLALLISSLVLQHQPVIERRRPCWINIVREWIEEDFAVTPTLSVLARQVDRDPAYVAATFKRFFGVSIGVYVRRLRLRAACSYLDQPSGSLSEIALRCGYADQSHFARHFKRAFHLTPGEYRQRYRQRAVAC